MFVRMMYKRCAALLVSGLLAGGAVASPDDNVSVNVVESDWEGEVELTIPMAQIGDANGDGTVNTDDIIEVVSFILGHPSDKFHKTLADANADGTINAADIVVITNIIKED